MRREDEWVTWEFFEDSYKLPALNFRERCNFERRMIFMRRKR